MLNRATFVEDIPSCLLAKKELILLAGISLSGLSPASSKWEEEMEKSLGQKTTPKCTKSASGKNIWHRARQPIGNSIAQPRYTQTPELSTLTVNRINRYPQTL